MTTEERTRAATSPISPPTSTAIASRPGARRGDDREPAARGAHLPAAARLQGAGQRQRRLHLRPRRQRGGLPRLLDGGGEADRLDRALDGAARLADAVCQVVRRRQAEHQRQLPGPPRGQRAGPEGRLLLGGRARRHPHAHLPGPAGRDVPDGQRPARAGHQEGRPGRHLHAHDPGAAGRHAGLRPDRRAAQRGLRRLQRRCPGGAHRGRRVRGGDHRRRRLSQGRHRAAQGQRRRGHRADLIGQALRGRQAHGRRGRLDGGPGPMVARPGGRPAHRRRSGADGLRGPALPAVHLRHDRQAEGDHAHHRRLPGGDQHHPSVHLRHQAGGRVLVHGRHRLGDRALLHRLWPARQCDHRDHLRGRHRPPGQGPMGPDRGQVLTRRSCTPPPPPSGR